jgi:DNA-binding HxlR family transcriptional regulator
MPAPKPATMACMEISPLDVDPGLKARRESALDCSIDRALQVVGTRSAMLLLREAFYGVTRFDALTARVGVSEPVAAARLKELVAHGLLAREPYREPGQRTRHAYRLTEKGTELLPVLVALLQWGDRWEPEDGGERSRPRSGRRGPPARSRGARPRSAARRRPARRTPHGSARPARRRPRAPSDHPIAGGRRAPGAAPCPSR